MKCGICLERFDACTKLPMILECKHIICRQCLREIAHKFAVCPFGREKITMPLHKLEVNVSLLEEMARVESILSSQNMGNQASESNLQAQKASFRSNVKCLFNHLLKYVPENSVIFIQKNGPKKCTFCSALSNQGTWVCKHCSFYICNICFHQEQQAQARELPAYAKCSNRHQLYLYTSTSEFYSRTYGNDGCIVCAICMVKWYGESWSCRACKYDICMQCKQLLGDLYWDSYSPCQLVELFSGLKMEHQEALQKAYLWCIENKRAENRVLQEEVRENTEIQERERNLLKCSDGHSFINTGCSSISLTCSSCSITLQNNQFQCKKCSLKICSECYNLSYNPVSTQKGMMLCPNGHKVSRGQYNLLRYMCTYCNQPLSTEALHCAECKFSLCESCMGVIRSGISRGLSKGCNQGHELKWSYDTTRFYTSIQGGKMGCDVCRNFFECSGSFSCRACSFDICILCSARHLK